MDIKLKSFLDKRLKNKRLESDLDINKSKSTLKINSSRQGCQIEKPQDSRQISSIKPVGFWGKIEKLISDVIDAWII